MTLDPKWQSDLLESVQNEFKAHEIRSQNISQWSNRLNTEYQFKINEIAHSVPQILHQYGIVCSVHPDLKSRIGASILAKFWTRCYDGASRPLDSLTFRLMDNGILSVMSGDRSFESLDIKKRDEIEKIPEIFTRHISLTMKEYLARTLL